MKLDERAQQASRAVHVAVEGVSPSPLPSRRVIAARRVAIALALIATAGYFSSQLFGNLGNLGVETTDQPPSEVRDEGSREEDGQSDSSAPGPISTVSPGRTGETSSSGTGGSSKDSGSGGSPPAGTIPQSGSTVIELTPPYAESFSVNQCDGAGDCTAEATADKATGAATVRGTANGTADGTASSNPLAMIKQPFTVPGGASSATFTVTLDVESAEAEKSPFGSQADVRLLAGVGVCCVPRYSETIVDADPSTPTPSSWGPARSHTFTFTFGGGFKGGSQVYLGLNGVANVGGDLPGPYAQVQAAVKFTRVKITFSG